MNNWISNAPKCWKCGNKLNTARDGTVVFVLHLVDGVNQVKVHKQCKEMIDKPKSFADGNYLLKDGP